MSSSYTTKNLKRSGVASTTTGTDMFAPQSTPAVAPPADMYFGRARAPDRPVPGHVHVEQQQQQPLRPGSRRNAFSSSRGAATVPDTVQQEQISQRIYDRNHSAAVTAQLLSLGPARATPARNYDPAAAAALAPLPEQHAQLLATPVAPTGHAWLLGAQRAPAGAFAAVVALESQLQNRGLVAHNRSAPQAQWAPATPLSATAGPAPLAPKHKFPAAQVGSSQRAEWTHANLPAPAAGEFNAPVSVKGGAA